MADLIIAERSDIVAIADAVRGKTGDTKELTLGGIVSEINGIEVVEEVEQATPAITVSSAGLITASATQAAGKVTAGTKTATKQLTTQATKTVTPTTSKQTAVASGTYTTGAVYVAGDSNLVAENIKSGVSIFGVAGSYEGGGSSSGGSTETCTVKIEIDAFGVTPKVFATICENGTITSISDEGVFDGLSVTTFTLANVVCGSVIYIENAPGSLMDIQNAVELTNGCVQITAANGETSYLFYM